MAELAEFEALVPAEHGLATMTVIGADGRMRPSVVNVGVLDHPLTGARVVGAVIHGQARKLVNLRARPRISVVLRAGWQWAGVEGPAEIIGPDDPAEGIDAERLRSSCARCSSRRAARTRTSTNTTGSWPPSAAPPS